jgi:hypothetical protein
LEISRNIFDFLPFEVRCSPFFFIASSKTCDIQKNFNDFGQSDTRFNNALSNLFRNQWYKNNSDWLFKNLRGPLIHQYRPGDPILLTSYCKNKVDLNLHLTDVDGKKVFVLERLFSDFKLAAQKLKNEVKKPSNSLNKRKINNEFMAIVEINISSEDEIFGKTSFFPESSGTTSLKIDE